jgi:hypothetical protein
VSSQKTFLPCTEHVKVVTPVKVIYIIIYLIHFIVYLHKIELMALACETDVKLVGAVDALHVLVCCEKVYLHIIITKIIMILLLLLYL